MESKSEQIATPDSLADEYDKSVLEGQDYIRRCWGRLHQKTKDWLIEQEHFNERGLPTPIEGGSGMDAAETLEYELGMLQRCANADLPSRHSKKGEIIPAEALRDEVLDSAASMMSSQTSHEVEFLRLALIAVQRHQMANLLTRLPTKNPDEERYLAAFQFLLLLLSMFLLLCSPALVGMALVSGSTGDYQGTIFACYGLGFVWLIWRWQRNLSEQKTLSPDEIAYESWSMLNRFSGIGPWVIAGFGTTAYLQQMQKKGVRVPPVAFDLSAILAARVVEP